MSTGKHGMGTYAGILGGIGGVACSSPSNQMVLGQQQMNVSSTAGGSLYGGTGIYPISLGLYGQQAPNLVPKYKLWELEMAIGQKATVSYIGSEFKILGIVSHLNKINVEFSDSTYGTVVFYDITNVPFIEEFRKKSLCQLVRN